MKNIINKLNKIITKSKKNFEDIIVQASSDKEKINLEEFSSAILKLDSKIEKSQLQGLFNKMDEAMLSDIYITDALDKYDEFVME